MVGILAISVTLTRLPFLKLISNSTCVFNINSDFSIKYIQLTDNSFKVLLGHEAPILSVALDNKLQYGVRGDELIAL